MIRRTLALATLLTMLLPGIGNSQNNYNLELISNVTYSNNCFDWYSDVWGFQHSNGTEYAVVGAGCHTLVYDLSNPTSPALIAEIEGDTSVWRDMKSYGDYIYAIADQGDDGLLVIDLTNPTDPVDSFFRPTFGIDTLIKGHNLYIDDSGFIYIAGSNINSGGVVIYHIGSDPFNPDLAGIGSGVYAHDVFVNDNLMITSELGNGFRISSLLFFGTFVFPVTEAVQETTNDFTHNAWTNGGASVCYTTDERSGAFVEAYDISDFGTGIELLDKYAPPGTIGSGVIPHNVQVAGDYLVVSYYRDGVKLVDATDPYNLVEVGSYDTSPLDSSGFNGAWGATPTLPSGLILVSDIEGGLFVFRPTFTRAAYLEGTVRDGMTGDTLPDASVKIFVFDSTTSMTDMYGEYSMGIVDQNTVPNPPADTNTVLVRASREGYSSKDSFITFVPGSIVTVDFDLLQAIVPVELISFNVEDEDCSNMLKWVVGSEINHSHFEVQTSRDGVTFTSIVKIFPNEKNSNVYHYQHEVVDPVRVYYRLLQMDLDGTTALSRVVQSTSKCEDSGVHIAPNPVRNNLEIKSSFLIEEISLYHPAGARLFHEKVNQPSLVQSLDLSGLPAGVYTLMLRQEGKVTSRKIVKIN